ncbi:MAG TPA: hypothetical protein VK790_06190 [Solirubrobacteraceae bacterium]|jgi:hypothetical protein|nr:hypothetical protein [Solirubrobacteraceae bacterium]
MTRSARTSGQLDAKALARVRREAMRQRAHRIRRAVAGLTAALFATAFLIIYVQLASGHDPALTANAAKRRAAAASATSVESSTESSASSSEASTRESPATGESASEESSGGASAVTTSQS